MHTKKFVQRPLQGICGYLTISCMLLC